MQGQRLLYASVSLAWRRVWRRVWLPVLALWLGEHRSSLQLHVVDVECVVGGRRVGGRRVGGRRVGVKLVQGGPVDRSRQVAHALLVPQLGLVDSGLSLAAVREGKQFRG